VGAWAGRRGVPVDREAAGAVFQPEWFSGSDQAPVAEYSLSSRRVASWPGLGLWPVDALEPRGGDDVIWSSLLEAPPPPPSLFGRVWSPPGIMLHVCMQHTFVALGITHRCPSQRTGWGLECITEPHFGLRCPLPPSHLHTPRALRQAEQSRRAQRTAARRILCRGGKGHTRTIQRRGTPPTHPAPGNTIKGVRGSRVCLRRVP